MLSFFVHADGFKTITREQFRNWMGILFLATVLFPFLVIMILRLTKLISDAYMHAPRDRMLPLVGTLIFYAASFYFFAQEVDAPFLMHVLLLGSVFSIVLDFIINLFYKVSVHTTSAGMMPGNFLVLCILSAATPAWLIAIAFAVALLVGLVRWWLGAHTRGQIVLGWAIGISMQLVAYSILK